MQNQYLKGGKLGFICFLIVVLCVNLISCRRNSAIRWDLIIKKYEEKGELEKIRAVNFLKDNIYEHNSVVVGLVDPSGKRLINIDTGNFKLDSIQNFIKEGWKIDFHKEKDVHILDEGNIIDMVDVSYRRWRENSKELNIPFDIYLKYILPYKVDNEFPGNWRVELDRQMQHLPEYLDKLDKVDSLSKKEKHWEYKKTVRTIQNLYYQYNETVPTFTTYPSFNEIKLRRQGDCYMGSVIATYCMRAAGVPSTIDFIPYWGSMNGSHSFDVHWDAKSMSLVKDYPFTIPVAKVFRRTYEKRDNNSDNIEIPERIIKENFDFIKVGFTDDVTSEHVPVQDIDYLVTEQSTSQIAFICVYSYGDWKPVFFGHLRGNRVSFKNMGTDILYRVAAETEDGKMKFLSPMFYLCRDGNLLFPKLSDEIHQSFDVEKINHGELSDIKKGISYTLYFVKPDGVEVKLQTKICTRTGKLSFANVPSSCFYIIKEAGTDGRLSRYFSMTNGKQEWFTTLVFADQKYAWPSTKKQ